MQHIYPTYYTRFSCLADRCRHNCCIGWEIDIDPDTYAFYTEQGGDFGERLHRGIVHGETPCFRLDADERCVFLNEQGLCDIIRTLGEDALCDICADHPRFRTYRDDSVHVGLGMCCEEACRLILSEDAAFVCEESGKLVAVDTALPTLTNTRAPTEWADVYRRLERMDPVWDAWLDELAKAPDWRMGDTDFTRRLGAYFRFRYPDEPLFAAHAVAVLDTLCAGRNTEERYEICRLYSAEIEYSDENRQIVCEQIKSATE